MAYQINWQERGVLFNYRGHTSDFEIAAATRIAQADARFDQLVYAIHDFLPCESFTYSVPKIEEIAAVASAAALSLRAPRLAIAIVTDRPQVRAAVDVYVESGLTPHDLRVFPSIGEARGWLSSVHRP